MQGQRGSYIHKLPLTYAHELAALGWPRACGLYSLVSSCALPAFALTAELRLAAPLCHMLKNLITWKENCNFEKKG